MSGDVVVFFVEKCDWRRRGDGEAAYCEIQMRQCMYVLE